MGEMGKWQKGRALRRIEQGLVFDMGPQEVLMPRKYVQEGWNLGDEVGVFLYRDSEDRPTVVPFRPCAQVGEFGLVTVKEVTSFGAFADWGLPKDLLIPLGEMEKPLVPGDKTPVKVLLDAETDRIFGTTRWGRHWDRDLSSLQIGLQGEAFVLGRHALGYAAAFDHRWQGLFYANETPGGLKTGETRTAYVKALRDQGKVDLFLRPLGFENSHPEAKTKVLVELEKAGGFLPLHDKSAPEAIQETLGLSKKAFKAAIGTLFKERKVAIEDDGIRLLK